MKIRMWIDTGFANAVHEEIQDFPELDGLSKEELQKDLDSIALDYLWNHVECGAEPTEDEEEKGR